MPFENVLDPPANNPHTVDPNLDPAMQDQGGNPEDGGDQAGGGDADQGDQGQGDSGQDTGSQGAGAGNSGAQGDQGGSGGDTGSSRIAELERELAETSNLLEDTRNWIKGDPVVLERLQTQSGGSGSQSGGGSLVAEFEGAIRDAIKPQAAEGLIKALAPALKRIESLERQLGGVTPTVNRLAQTVGTVDYREGLAEGGVPPEVQGTKNFQSFAAAMKNDRRYAGVAKSDQRTWGIVLGNAWIASRGKTGNWSADQSRLAAARGGRGAQSNGSQNGSGNNGSSNGHSGNGANRSNSTGGNLAKQVYKIVREPGGTHVDKAHQLRVRLQKEGKPLPDIEYVNAEAE